MRPHRWSAGRQWPPIGWSELPFFQRSFNRGLMRRAIADREDPQSAKPTPATTYGERVAVLSSSGTIRPTPSATAKAVSLVRHQASWVARWPDGCDGRVDGSAKSCSGSVGLSGSCSSSVVQQEGELSRVREQELVGAPELSIFLDEAVARQAGTEDRQVGVCWIGLGRRERGAEADRVVDRRREGRSRRRTTGAGTRSRIAAARAGRAGAAAGPSRRPSAARRRRRPPRRALGGRCSLIIAGIPSASAGSVRRAPLPGRRRHLDPEDPCACQLSENTACAVAWISPACSSRAVRKVARPPSRSILTASSAHPALGARGKWIVSERGARRSRLSFAARMNSAATNPVGPLPTSSARLSRRETALDDLLDLVSWSTWCAPSPRIMPVRARGGSLADPQRSCGRRSGAGADQFHLPSSSIGEGTSRARTMLASSARRGPCQRRSP